MPFTEKYLTKLTSHMKDSQADATDELRKTIRNGTKADFTELVEKLEGYLAGDTGMVRIEEAKAYILSNWMAAKLRLKHTDGVKGSSTEGHVSHVYADRMSSRPLAWSRTGADKMSRLRIYRQNNGDMLELVRYQKKEMKQVAGAEEVIYSASEMLDMEKANRKKLGMLADLPIYSIPYRKIKKIAALKNHIWGL